MPVVVKLPQQPRLLSALGAGFRSLRGLFQRAANLVPPTWTGFWVAAFSLAALWRFGYGKMDLLVFVISLSGLSLLGLGSLLTTGAAFYLRRRVLAGRDGAAGTALFPAVETGVPTETGFRLPALATVPMVKVKWRILAPPSVRARRRFRSGEWVEELIADRRCRVDSVVREVEVSDAFGLSRVAWRFTQRGDLRILPQPGRLGAIPPLQALSSAEGLPHPSGAPEGDRMEIRRYVPGDPVRHILWKVYARSRQLNVRVPEKSIDSSRRMVAYLLSGDSDEAAAAAARVALRNDLLGDRWLFAADGISQPVDRLDEALEAIAISGNPESRPATPAAGLRAFLDRPEVTDQVTCVVFAGAESGPWVDDLCAVARSFGGSITVVLGTDGVVGAEAKIRRFSWLWLDDPLPAAVTSEQLSGLMAVLTAAGHGVLVVDRQSGRSHVRGVGAAGGLRRAG